MPDTDLVACRDCGAMVPAADLGAMTVLDVAAAPDADAQCSRVADWAVEVRRAWSPHHDTVREWVARGS